MHVQDLVAVVGDEARPRLGPASEPHERAGDEAACHRDHLDGEREPPESVHHLRIVDDADERPRRCRHDLLASERTAAAFHEVAVSGGLVGAVHVDRKRAGGVEIDDPNPVSGEPRRSRLRACDRAVDSALDGRERVDERVRRGARAHPYQLAGDHELERGPGGCVFPGVLVHVDSSRCRGPYRRAEHCAKRPRDRRRPARLKDQGPSVH